MANGNSVVFQFGKESTYGTKVTGTEQIKISSESLKEVYNKIDEGLAVGGRGSGKLATMGIGVEGSVATLFRPDMGLILKLALGDEDTESTTSGTKHTFTAISNSPSVHLPSCTAYVDRVIEKCAYSGSKINNLNLSANAGNYLSCEVSFIGKKEDVGTSLNSNLNPSTLKAFKFAQGKVYIDSDEVADITSMSLSYNNNLTGQVQTTSTGNYYKEPEVGVREITSSLNLIYSQSAETIRQELYKSDDTFALKLEFISDEVISGTEKYKMTINIPCCQCADSSANMGGLETLTESLEVKAIDNLSDELIEIELTNTNSGEY